MPTYTIKTGSTFKPSCQYVDDAGASLPLTGIAIAAQIRTQAGLLVATLTAVDRNDSAGTYRLTSDVQPTNWPKAPLLLDIKYTGTDSVARHTETVVIDVVQGQTA